MTGAPIIHQECYFDRHRLSEAPGPCCRNIFIPIDTRWFCRLSDNRTLAAYPVTYMMSLRLLISLKSALMPQ